MPYDLFISYSRKDNLTKRVTELKTQIETDYLEFTKEPLNCFFDQEEIKGMDDWQHRLLQGLKDSDLLLVILSPNYLASPYCEWEIVEYLKYEYSRGVAGDGVAQVYFMEIPGIDDEDFRANAAAWLEKVSRRQRIDLRPWREEGADSLKRLDVNKRLEELKESLRKRITRMRVISEVPGNLPAPNPRFVGREREMEMLHKATALGQQGVITAVHGVGGLGKTAIAFQYAYAYANFYPGGRWYLGCANETNLASVIKKLDADLNIILTEDEKKDDIRGAKRILNELFNRAVENAEKANNKTNISRTDKEYIKPAVLLILDNVDNPDLIQPPYSDIISGKEWLKVLITTRMGPEELGEDETTQKFLTIDELPFSDGVSLIESYQPGGRFKNREEKEKAKEIVKLLDGFTLAVEVAALYLYEKKGKISCADFVTLLKYKGIDFVSEKTNKKLRHTKLISATLAPTLELLSLEESLILRYASMLHPDFIYVSWLKTLVLDEFPNLLDKISVGEVDPWYNALNRLFSLRLLQIVEVDKDLEPRILRLHRLIKSLCQEKSFTKRQSLRKKVFDSISDFKEAEPLYRQVLKETEDVIPIDNLAFASAQADLGRLLLSKFQYNEAGTLIQSALKIYTSEYGEDHPDTLVVLNDFAFWAQGTGDLNTAGNIFKKIINAQMKGLTKDHPNLAISFSNLSLIEKKRGNFDEAENLLRKALEIDISHYGGTNLKVAKDLNNLTQLLLDSPKNRLEESFPLIQKALEIFETHSNTNDPDYTNLLSNYGLLLNSVGQKGMAKSCFQKALSIDEVCFGTNHPNTARDLKNLAFLLLDTGETQTAESLMRRALNIDEICFGPTHLNVAHDLYNLAYLLLVTKGFNESEPLFTKSLDIFKSTLGNGSDIIYEKFGKEFRSLALKLFNDGDYSTTKEVLVFLISTGFETISTYIHLIRVSIILNQTVKAIEYLDLAWKNRSEASFYVNARILWFKIAFSFLTKSSNDNYISQLRTILQNEDAFVLWTMKPVLDQIKPQITEHQHALLSALVDAMSNKEDKEKLNDFKEWREAKPEEID